MYIAIVRNMKFLRLDTTDPYYNLAVEEYLFRHAEDDVFMLWQNDKTVVIGKNQNAYAEINREYLDANGVRVARRITGGGAVYHDLGNLNYTFLSVTEGGKTLDFAAFTEPITEALASLGVVATLSGRNDLEVDGKKFSGNAQHAAGGRVLHHGTLLFSSDLEALSEALKVDPEKIKAKAIGSTKARVTNLSPLLPDVKSVKKFADLIEEYVTKVFAAEKIEDPKGEEIDELCRRNASREWIFPDKGLVARYSTVKKKRYPFGSVELYLEMSGEVIRDLRIRGDFFGIRPIEELEQILKGMCLEEIPKTLEGVPVEDYIFGMTGVELAEQLK